jgi:hypothetical protein
MRILLVKTPWSTSSLSIGPRSRRARATIVRDVNRTFRRALALLARFVELGGGLS